MRRDMAVVRADLKTTHVLVSATPSLETVTMCRGRMTKCTACASWWAGFADVMLLICEGWPFAWIVGCHLA